MFISLDTSRLASGLFIFKNLSDLKTLIQTVFLGIMLVSMSNIVLCQTSLDKSRQKMVKEIYKDILKQHDEILKNQVITCD